MNCPSVMYLYQCLLYSSFKVSIDFNFNIFHFELLKQFNVLSQNILWSVDHRQGAWEAGLMIVINMTPSAMMVMMVYSPLLCSSPSQHLTQPQARFS